MIVSKENWGVEAWMPKRVRVCIGALRSDDLGIVEQALWVLELLCKHRPKWRKGEIENGIRYPSRYFRIANKEFDRALERGEWSRLVRADALRQRAWTAPMRARPRVHDEEYREWERYIRSVWHAFVVVADRWEDLTDEMRSDAQRAFETLQVVLNRDRRLMERCILEVAIKAKYPARVFEMLQPGRAVEFVERSIRTIVVECGPEGEAPEQILEMNLLARPDERNIRMGFAQDKLIHRPIAKSSIESVGADESLLYLDWACRNFNSAAPLTEELATIAVHKASILSRLELRKALEMRLERKSKVGEFEQTFLNEWVPRIMSIVGDFGFNIHCTGKKASEELGFHPESASVNQAVWHLSARLVSENFDCEAFVLAAKSMKRLYNTLLGMVRKSRARQSDQIFVERDQAAHIVDLALFEFWNRHRDKLTKMYSPQYFLFLVKGEILKLVRHEFSIRRSQVSLAPEKEVGVYEAVDTLIIAERAEKFWREVSKLPENQSRILKAEMQGRRMEEVASELELSMENVSKLKHRAKKRLSMSAVLRDLVDAS